MPRSDDHPGTSLRLSHLFEDIRPLLAAQPQPVYLVGGAVRDAIMGKSSKDLDFVVPTDAIELAFRVGDHLNVPAFVMDRERDIGRVVLSARRMTLDFARVRGPNIDADLRARDFTINALALPAEPVTSLKIIDVVGGVSDIQSRLIRYTHELSIVEDPVRAMRGIRLAAQLNFDITDETEIAIRRAAPLLAQISRERIRDELIKLLSVEVPGRAISKLYETGLLEHTIPKLALLKNVDQSVPHHEDAFAHTCRVLTSLSNLVTTILSEKTGKNPWIEEIRRHLASYSADLAIHLNRDVGGSLTGTDVLRIAALFHDIGKAETGAVDERSGRIRFHRHEQIGAEVSQRAMTSLRFSNEAIAHVKQVIAAHMRPLWLSQIPKVSRRAIYRFNRDTGEAGVDVCLLALADELSLYSSDRQAKEVEPRMLDLLKVVEGLIGNYFRRFQESVRPKPLLNGRDLMNVFGLREGREIGRLLRIIEEAQAIGQISSRDEALALAKKHGQ